jgi:hypothetical protein
MAKNEPNLHVVSRIYYGIYHPIQYNVKAKAIGYVPSNYLATLIGSWRAESEVTEQAIEVTVDAFRTNRGSNNGVQEAS